MCFRDLHNNPCTSDLVRSITSKEIGHVMTLSGVFQAIISSDDGLPITDVCTEAIDSAISFVDFCNLCTLDSLGEQMGTVSPISIFSNNDLTAVGELLLYPGNIVSLSKISKDGKIFNKIKVSSKPNGNGHMLFQMAAQVMHITYCYMTKLECNI